MSLKRTNLPITSTRETSNGGSRSVGRHSRRLIQSYNFVTTMLCAVSRCLCLCLACVKATLLRAFALQINLSTPLLCLINTCYDVINTRCL